MKSRKMAAWLMVFAGVVMLVLGAASVRAQDPIEIYPPDEYDKCVAECNKNPGPKRTVAQCIQEDCEKIINCADNCNICDNFGGDDTKECAKVNANCGTAFGPNYCVNGLCKCTQRTESRLGITYYICKCERPS